MKPLSWWKRLRGVLVVNTVPDEEEETITAYPDPKEEEDLHNPQVKQEKFNFCRFELRIIYLIILCIFLGLIIPYLLAEYAFPARDPTTQPYCYVDIAYRFPCALPNSSKSESFQQQCEAKGCCFDENFNMNVFSPKCFHRIPSYFGYTVSGVNSHSVASPLLTAFKLGQNTGDDLAIDLKSYNKINSYNGEMWDAVLYIKRCSPSVIWIKMKGATGDDIGESECLKDPVTEPGYGEIEVMATVDVNKTLTINISRTSEYNKTRIFETKFGPLQYGPNLREITTSFASKNVFGLGQSNNFDNRPSFSYWDSWSVFSRESSHNFTGTSGAHSFAMVIEDTGHAHGIYFYNPGLLQVQSVDIPGAAIKSVTGWIDIRFFAGPLPADVTAQYTSLIGRPSMPPYWALGYHMCRGSDETQDLQKELYDNITQMMNSQNVPYESDCINSRLNYPMSWGPLADWVEDDVTALKVNNRRFIQINYPFMESSVNLFSIVKTPLDTPYYGKIVNTTVVYPDYLADSVVGDVVSHQDLGQTFSQADGVVMLQNSPLNEIDSIEVDDWSQCKEDTPKNCCPPYKGEALSSTPTEGTICWGALHAQHPSALQQTEHLTVHNVYGYYHTKAIKDIIDSNGSPLKRRLMLSSSTSSKSGTVGGYFEENYTPDFVSQQQGLIKVIEMGLYGIPLAGVPVCGSIDYNEEDTIKINEWCLRSHQTGAFYPLMMSYYQPGQLPRHPSDFTPRFIDQLKIYIKQRYMFMPHIYTLFKQASQTGVPVVRPLFYEFPQDLRTNEVSDSVDVDDEFLLGDKILVCPVYRSIGETVVENKLYFPPGCWYNLYSGIMVSSNMTDGTHLNVTSLLNEVNVFLKGGLILPLQGNLHDEIRSSKDAKLKPHHLIVCMACGDDITGEGELYQDDGETPFDASTNTPPQDHNLITFSSTNTSVTVTSNTTNYCGSAADISTTIGEIKIYGTGAVEHVSMTTNAHPSYKQDPDSLVLTVTANYNWCSDTSFTVSWEIKQEGTVP